jgi:hypothetical protein
MMDNLLPRPHIPSSLVLFGLFFNALLAFVNAHGVQVATVHVMAMEALTMLGIMVAVRPVWERDMAPWGWFAFAFLILFLWGVLFNAFLGQNVNPKPLRDILLISLFAMLGMAYHKQSGNIIALFRVAAILVLVFVLIENYATEFYASTLNPAQYYANTRGIEDTSLFGKLDTGLFVNTQMIEGRFSLGFITNHRLGSLFLEQTSLANFAIMLVMFSTLFWKKFSRADKVIFSLSALLSVMGSDSRMAFGLCLLFAGGYFLFPLVPRKLNLLAMPALLILSWILFYDPTMMSLEDTLKGRFAWSLTQLSNVDLIGALGGHPEKMYRSMDSGYAYMLYGQTVFGLIIFWLFTSLIVPQTTSNGKRLANALAIFLAINLMTGPTVLSIKAAALLWFMVGYVIRDIRHAPNTEESPA